MFMRHELPRQQAALAVVILVGAICLAPRDPRADAETGSRLRRNNHGVTVIESGTVGQVFADSR